MQHGDVGYWDELCPQVLDRKEWVKYDFIMPLKMACNLKLIISAILNLIFGTQLIMGNKMQKAKSRVRGTTEPLWQ